MDKLMDSPWFLRFTALFLAIILFFSVKAGEERSAVGSAQNMIRDIPVDVFYDNENLVVTGVRGVNGIIVFTHWVEIVRYNYSP